MTWEEVLWRMTTRGHFPTKNGKYVARVSEDGSHHYLGMFEDIEEAKSMVFCYRMDRLLSSLKSYELDIEDAVVFEEKYLVFKEGMIFNLNGKKMEGRLRSNGDIQIKLNGRELLLHRIVAECFISNPKNYKEVVHLNGDKDDNSVWNLQWCRKNDIMIYAAKSKGEEHYNSKLTEEDVRYIRRSKQNEEALSKKFGVSQGLISAIKTKKIWKHVV